MFGSVVIFGAPLTVAAVMLSPQGLNFVVNGIVRYSGVVLLLLPFAAWPVFLAQAVVPPPGQGRLRAIVSLWLGGSVLVSAVMNLLGSMLDYSPHPLNFNPEGHRLIAYNPRAGLILGGFMLCMLVATGVWGVLARVLPIGFVRRGAVVTGLLLFGAVAGLGYALSPPSTSAVAQPIWPQGQGQASAASRPAHVEDGGDYWQPEDGYHWLTAHQDDLRVKWKPGSPSRWRPHVVASDEEGEWEAQDGYRWVDPDRPKDYRVMPISAR
jgi:hypothetical protein